VIGLAGVFGDERGRQQAQRVFGTSKNRISNAEKQFARSQRDKNGELRTISKDPNTGKITLIPPTAPARTQYGAGSAPQNLANIAGIYSQSPALNHPTQRGSFLDRDDKLTY